jgi:uncharacterized protein (UPF0332 family)
MASLSADLLDQAEELLTKEKKKPKQANVRRAISTAYYALFHFISDKVTREIVGATHDLAHVRAWLGRALVHKTMRSACICFANPKDKAFVALASQLKFATSVNLASLATAFVELQDLRHQADYDLSSPVTRKDAERAVNEVRSAITKWGAIEVQNPELIQIFSLSLLNWNNLSKYS